MDEMLPRALAEQLNRRGHDSVSVFDVDLAGAGDNEVFDRAVDEERVIVTENFGDYSLLLEARLRSEEPRVPVVFVRKARFPTSGALAVHLAEHLHRWAVANPHPYIGPHRP